MKANFLVKSTLIILFISILAGCDLSKPDEEPVKNDEYLLSYEKQKSYLPAFIQLIVQNITTKYSEMQDLVNEFEHGIDIYSITYTTTFEGKPVTASGLVSLPTTQGIAFPVMSFQNGTITSDIEAPSLNPDYEFYLLLEFIASSGFVVSIPDYLGFGASDQMFHPYLDKESTVQSVTDMIRAVKELVNNHLEISINDDLYISGYSQGGWATLQLQKSIEENHSSEFNLKASACGAGPYDLNYINKYILEQTDYSQPYFAGYIFNSYIQLGIITNSTSDVFKSPYDERITTIYDGTKLGYELNAQLTTKVADLFTEDYRQHAYTDEKFSSIVSGLTANSISAWKTNIPTMIATGTADDFVPPEVSFSIYQNFLLEGVDADKLIYVPIQGEDHESAVIPVEAVSLKWFIELKNGM